MPDHKLTSYRSIFRTALFAITFISFYTGFSQNHRIGVSSSYNVPIGGLAWGYSPGIGVKLDYSSIRVKKTGRSTAGGLSIGYTVLQPRADTLYYVVDEGGVHVPGSGGGAGMGTAVFSPFRMIHLDATWGWGLPVGKKLSFTPGFHAGLLYGKRVVDFRDSFGAADGINEFVTWGAFSPKVGLEYKFNDHLSTTLFGAYTFIIQLGSTNPDAMDFNEDTGLFYHFYSPGLSLNFSF